MTDPSCMVSSCGQKNVLIPSICCIIEDSFLVGLASIRCIRWDSSEFRVSTKFQLRLSRGFDFREDNLPSPNVG